MTTASCGAHIYIFISAIQPTSEEVQNAENKTNHNQPITGLHSYTQSLIGLPSIVSRATLGWKPKAIDVPHIIKSGDVSGAPGQLVLPVHRSPVAD